MRLLLEDDRCLRIVGVVDSRAVAQIRSALKDLASGHHDNVMVNAQEMQIRDSALIGVFAKFHHELRLEGRSLVLLNPGPALERMLRVTKLGRVMTIAFSGESREPALVRPLQAPVSSPSRVPRPRPH